MSLKKTLFIVLDGLGDEPIMHLDGMTPLEAAKTPKMDSLAHDGLTGLVRSYHGGATPTSEESHFAMFGYDPGVHNLRRGAITATGAGIEMGDGDVAFRGNLATVGEDMEMIDRRAGRVKDPKPFIKALRKIEIEGVEVTIESATEHRLGIVFRGEGLNPRVSDGDPFYGELGDKARKIEPLEEGAEKMAKVLNEFLEKARKVLGSHRKNKKRDEIGLPEVNYVLTRGGSSLSHLPSFDDRYGLSAACIAGKFLYQQIGELLGMDVLKVRGATGKPNTNLSGKFKRAVKALDDYEFVFLHIKATDSLAEDGRWRDKMEFIEKIDREMPDLELLENVRVVITCDHSTCSLMRRHCYNLCPLLVWGRDIDGTEVFSEKACKKGGLGVIEQIDIMTRVVGVLPDDYNG